MASQCSEGGHEPVQVWSNRCSYTLPRFCRATCHLLSAISSIEILISGTLFKRGKIVDADSLYTVYGERLYKDLRK